MPEVVAEVEDRTPHQEVQVVPVEAVQVDKQVQVQEQELMQLTLLAAVEAVEEVQTQQHLREVGTLVLVVLES